MGPWSPNWRPDPTGRRLAAIRLARRGGLLAGLIFTPLVWLAAELTPRDAVALPPPPLDGSSWMLGAVLVALFCAPGITLLGAGLAGSALGPRSTAAITGVAIAVGVPVAAVTSAMIGVFVAIAVGNGIGDATAIAGQLLRGGVTAAVRVSPLIVLGSVVWIALVRRFARFAA
jgi:hypothetical protein